MRIRSRAAPARPAGIHRLRDRRTLHGSAEHLVGSDSVHHFIEGRLLFLIVLGPIHALVADRGGRLLRIRAYRTLHARGRVDAVTSQDIVDPRQSLGEAIVLTCIELIVQI